MRVYFSSIAAIAVALLFVSGTVGCRSNGGDWYKPTTYSWTNPFAKNSPVTPRPSDAFADAKKPKPTLGAHPDISAPQGGYSDASSLANRSPSPAGTSGGFAPDPWGQQSPPASHTPPNHLGGGYVIAESSSYPPPYVTSEQTAGGQQTSYITQQNTMPYGPSDYERTGYHQPVTPGVYQQPPQQASMGPYGGMEQQGQYAPFGVMQNDPYGAIQQPVVVPPAGFGFEQQQPAQAYPQGFPGGGVPVGGPYQ